MFAATNCTMLQNACEQQVAHQYAALLMLSKGCAGLPDMVCTSRHSWCPTGTAPACTSNGSRERAHAAGRTIVTSWRACLLVSLSGVSCA